MPRQSSVRRLPAEIRDRIGALLDQGRTLDEILEHLADLDVHVSRSALGRYKQSIDKASERIRRSREMAEALVRNLGDEPESKTTRLNIELMHSVLTDMILQLPNPGDEPQEGEEGQNVLVSVNPMGVMLMSKALDHLAKAKKNDADLVEKLREQALKEAAEAVDKVAQAQGLSDEARAAMRQELGVPS